MIDYNYKKNIYWIILAFPFILSTTCWAMSNDSLKTKEDISPMSEKLKLEIELDKQLYKIEDPIIIKCNISNLGHDSINLHPILFMDLLINLKYQDSPEVMPFGPKILLKELIRKEDIIKLDPGEIYSFKRTVSKDTYIMPSKAGHYEFYVTYSNLVKELGGIKLWVGEIKSNTVKFEIPTNSK